MPENYGLFTRKWQQLPFHSHCGLPLLRVALVTSRGAGTCATHPCPCSGARTLPGDHWSVQVLSLNFPADFEAGILTWPDAQSLEPQRAFRWGGRELRAMQRTNGAPTECGHAAQVSHRWNILCYFSINENSLPFCLSYITEKPGWFWRNQGILPAHC